ncbi:MAG: T9SS type A sorting domain-containing protein [Flavobacteriales bacterium]|nr:T9SS type A sorting domain-containing protein [Flavobacteriales bacterium]
MPTNTLHAGRFAMLVAACIPLLLWHPSKAAVDIGLYPTAVPDSFELRVATDGEDLTAILGNLVVTVRWDASAGGTITGQDVRSDCGAYAFYPNGSGVVIQGSYAYYTFLILSIRPLEDECPITNTLEPIGGFRIQGLSGCRRVELVNDPLVTVTNSSYFISVGGANETGNVLTGPLTSGSCPPCVPPVLGPAIARELYYNGPIELFAFATGTDVAQLWSRTPNYQVYSYSLQDTVPPIPIAQTTVYFAVWNHCGMDGVTVPIERVTETCSGPPFIESVNSQWGFACSTLDLHAMVTPNGICTYQWTGPVEITASTPSVTLVDGIPGTYGFIAVNDCGSDTFMIEVSLDTTGCIPPVIDSLSYTPAFCAGEPVILTAHSSSTGACLYYDWGGPEAILVPDGAPTSTVTGVQSSGPYWLILSNSCGTDSATVLLESLDPCTPPVIDSLSSNAPFCAGEALVLTAHTSSADACPIYDWGGPGLVNYPDGAPECTVFSATSLGPYQLILSNACGSDTAQLMITAPYPCISPLIDTLTANSTILCSGDTLRLMVEHQGYPLCTDVVWTLPGGGTVQTEGTTLVRSPFEVGTYSVTVYNACGISTRTISIATTSTIATNKNVCTGDTPAPLSPFVPPGGSWSLNGQPVDSIFDPATGIPGTYFYHLDTTSTCAYLSVNILLWPTLRAGVGDSIVVCTTDPPLDLFTVLTGDPDPGGTWRYGFIGGLLDGIFYPGSLPATTYRYSHLICSDTTAYVHITAEVASSWYPDTDGDGLGDASEVVMGCLQPDGFVTDSTDQCPNTPGTIGSPCDDGLSYTHNDSIDGTCTCVGELMTGLTSPDRGSASLRIWPNPVGAGEHTLRLVGLRGARNEVVIFDGLGAVVALFPAISSDPTGSATLHLPNALAAGVYSVDVRSPGDRQRAKLIVGAP